MMKQLVFFLFLFFFICSYAQDTLYLPVHGLGHEKYVLKDDANFIYSSSLCGSNFVSFGTYKKTIFGYSFDYDTTKCPNPIVLSINDDHINNNIALFFHNMLDSTRQPNYNSLSVGSIKYNCDIDSILIPRTSIKSNILIVSDLSGSLVFNFDTTASELHIYLPPIGLGYNCGIHDVRKLKKTKLGYLHKFIVYDENRDKPWKRGTKRIVRHYYQLRQKK
jgi:hypothetical protein